MYVVEQLTLRVWFLTVLPRLIRDRIRKDGSPVRCHVIDASPLALAAVKATAWIGGAQVQRFHFRLEDVRDEAGQSVRLRILYEDLAQVQADAMGEAALWNALHGARREERLGTFLAKRLATVNQTDRNTLWGALILVQICAWKARKEHLRQTFPTLVLEQRPWLGPIERYASRHGVRMLAVRPALRPRIMVREVLGERFLEALRSLRHRLSGWRVGLPMGPDAAASNLPGADGLRVAVPYIGHLNLDHPERFSDLFFWQQSSLNGRNLLLMFGVPSDPLDEPKWAQLARHEIGVVVLDPGARTIRQAPLWIHRPRGHQRPAAGARQEPVPLSSESRWVRKQLERYTSLRDYWGDLFAACGVKIYVSWYKYDETHCVIADALNALGGITAIYQRAYEALPSAETTIAADLVFGFSREVADVERRSNSIIDYYVTTGYLGDHRFPLLRQQAEQLRSVLRARGAKRILACFDENTTDDGRWEFGHEPMRRYYEFLLERLLAEPWLGLIFKPKTPRTLRRRLGPVAELLARAEATGRCYVFQEGTIQGSHSPVTAALASDVAVHAHLYSATAGLEAALAGVPTLLMDGEGWSGSPFYRLGVGRVVFTDWTALWQACREHWEMPGGIPGFGDWSSLYEELDPFRDGRAAERMGTYLCWLVEGFKAGQDRETVMADAAQRYGEIWGHDKVTRINVGDERAHPRRQREPLATGQAVHAVPQGVAR